MDTLGFLHVILDKGLCNDYYTTIMIFLSFVTPKAFIVINKLSFLLIAGLIQQNEVNFLLTSHKLIDKYFQTNLCTVYKMKPKERGRTMNLLTFLVIINLCFPLVVGAQHAVLVKI